MKIQNNIYSNVSNLTFKIKLFMNNHIFKLHNSIIFKWHSYHSYNLLFKNVYLIIIMYIKRIIILIKYGETQYLLLIYYSIFRQKR